MEKNFGSAAAQITNRGLILSDVNGTLVSLKDGTPFFKEYAVFLAAMKHSGYDVAFHSKDASGNENLLPRQFAMAQIGLELSDFEFDGAYVLSKESETAGMKALLAVDDEPNSHSAIAQYKMDTNDPYAKAGIKRIAAAFEASGRTATFTFNPADFAAPSLDLQRREPVLT